MLFVCVCMCIYGVFRPQFHLQLNLGLFFIFACASHTHSRTESKGHKWPEWDHARNWEAKVGGGALGGMGVVGVARGIK